MICPLSLFPYSESPSYSVCGSGKGSYSTSSWIKGNIEGNFARQRTGNTYGCRWDHLSQFLGIYLTKGCFLDVLVHTRRKALTWLSIAVQNACQKTLQS
jgi:hypothetical protein